ncbi:hypothetical protein QLS71_008005 [Mariniflexile litorale]|uniref:Uncharacterized protein n=1 Tax=Mariniflexile litorale TaxID=3045158 RepID=A0AAU7EK32_9FLAO|nr:hypothetical protein [Mariniflexile sp. KMM 9835]MDQ8213276.1 hypothetical protein [Mariniflexile sp. KMM 9835]
MATSIIRFKEKRIDINDNFLLLGLSYIKQSATGKDNPNWFNLYIDNVIDEMLDIKPVGWGYMELDTYIIDSERKKFFIDVIDNTIDVLKNRDSNTVDFTEANRLLNLKGLEAWKEKHYVEIEYILRFLDDLKILLDDNTPLNHIRLMKTNSN